MLRTFQNPNSLRIGLLLILSFGFSTTLMGYETVKRYYPAAPGSYWVYKDQDGKELTRYASVDKQQERNTYHTFQYAPEINDPGFYLYQIHPYLYKVDENGIAYLVGRKGEAAVRRINTKILDLFVPNLRKVLSEKFPKSVFNFSYTVDANMSNTFQLLPASIRRDKEWEAMKTKITITFTTEERKEREKPEETVFTNHITFEEIGTVKGTEKVKTPAGTFKDCLKIVFENKEVSSRSSKNEMGGFELSHGKSLTTIWLAPDVGIVKWEYDSEDTDSISVFELTKYEIKPARSRNTSSGSQ